MTPENLPSLIPHWIGGEAVEAADGRTFDVADPASNSVYAQAARILRLRLARSAP